MTQEVRMRGVVAGLMALALAAMAACSKSGALQSKSAVQAAIEEHLKQKPNMMFQNMTVEVAEVKFSGDTAEAQAKFRSKQAPELVVGVHYMLRKAGDRWQVESSSPASGEGMHPHGGGTGARPAGGMGAPGTAPTAAGPAPQSSH
jgi:hypothetical protein